MLGINWKMSTAFHPQTDGQTERVNQDIQKYLRMFAIKKGADWLEWLLAAEFNYNNTPHCSTGKSPFAINHMYVPKTLVAKQREGLAPAANEVAQTFHEVHEALGEVQAQMKDVGHCGTPMYQKGQ